MGIKRSTLYYKPKGKYEKLILERGKIMRFIDLTYEISEKTLMYPGLFKPKIIQECTLEKNGVNIKRLNLITHTGTHIDASSHVFQKGITIDRIPLNKFIGEAVYINFSNIKTGSVIIVSDFKKYENLISLNTIILLNTGIYKKYGKEEYNKEYPTLSLEAAKWLVDKGISSYATDATSVDINGETKIHKTFLSNNIPIIENLANLDKIKKDKFLFIALPLKINDGDGAPCRAVVIEDFEDIK